MAESSKRTWSGAAVAAIFLSLAILSMAWAAAWAQDTVSARQALMKANGAALRSIDKIIRAGGDAAEVVAPANRIAGNAAQIPGLFPPGPADQDDSGARPEIWQKFSDFQAKAANLQYQAGFLASAAQSGDLATVRAQFDKVVLACGDCHNAYRRKRQ